MNHELFSIPTHRRTYQFEETNNSNVLLRSEVLNKLNNKHNSIIVSYPEAISERVVKRSVLNKKTITLSVLDKYHPNLLKELLIRK